VSSFWQALLSVSFFCLGLPASLSSGPHNLEDLSVSKSLINSIYKVPSHMEPVLRGSGDEDGYPRLPHCVTALCSVDVGPSARRLALVIALGQQPRPNISMVSLCHSEWERVSSEGSGFLSGGVCLASYANGERKTELEVRRANFSVPLNSQKTQGNLLSLRELHFLPPHSEGLSQVCGRKICGTQTSPMHFCAHDGHY
jgi:hypothetical protein